MGKIIGALCRGKGLVPPGRYAGGDYPAPAAVALSPITPL